MFLENVNSPKDVKKIKIEDLPTLCDEVRKAIINRISKRGGHIGPNLGVVELTTALHYVFNSPVDKIVFDVSHQCYAHKILTGRKYAYLNDELLNSVTGYTNPNESEHDFFTVGHTSTSISLSLGLAYARDIKKEKDNIIALIGDGSLSGGEALEALSTAGEYNNNLIIVVNDNEQSIAENHGGLYNSLKELRESNGASSNNIFKAFNLDYVYIDEGNDVIKLVNLFSKIKDINHPIVVHVHTLKGKGLKYAEIYKEKYHGGGPFNVEDGSPKFPYNHENIIHNLVMDLLKNDDKAFIINSATPTVFEFYDELRERLIKEGRYLDVGIAEENAVAIASGAAKNGANVVYGTYAPFLQRTYDQLGHDLCLNNSPVTLLVVSTGAYANKSNTHLSLNDIQIFAHLPNMVYLAPSNNEELVNMFKYATNQNNHPVAIRIPGRIDYANIKDDTDYSKINKAKVISRGRDAAIITFGPLLDLAREVRDELKNKYNKEISLISPMFLSGIDKELLEELRKDHKLIITMEDGYLEGGYGESIASYYGDSDMKVVNLGISKHYHSEFNVDELLDENGMSLNKLIDVINKNL